MLDFGGRRLDGPAPEYSTSSFNSLLFAGNTRVATQRTDYGGGGGRFMVHVGGDVRHLLRADLGRTMGIAGVTEGWVWLLDDGAGDVWRMPYE